MVYVLLTNGKSEPELLVSGVLFSINRLMDEEPAVFFDLVKKCRDASNEISTASTTALEDLGLLCRGGRVHDSVQSIVQSAVVGDGLDMRITDPIAS